MGLDGVWVGLDLVAAACRRCPAEGAWSGLVKVPAWQVFDQVVFPAAAVKVAATRQSTPVPWDGVVDVGAPGGLPAGGMPAGFVSGGDVLAQARGWPVGR
jgi:hypothetical protein